MKKIEHSSSYKVGEGDVRLQAIIGEGQFGSSLAIVGSKTFDHMHDLDEVLGPASELRGKELMVLSVVTDTNAQTNRTSVTYRLTGGPAPLEQTLSFTVDNESDSVDYKATFRLE
jgi:hypothetical protein